MTNDQDTPRKMARVSRDQVETNERFYKIPKALFENEFYTEMKLETKKSFITQIHSHQANEVQMSA